VAEAQPRDIVAPAVSRQHGRSGLLPFYCEWGGHGTGSPHYRRRHLPKRRKVDKVKAKQPAPQQDEQKRQRGPRRWLDGESLILYERASSGGKSSGNTAWQDAFNEFKRRQRMALDAAAVRPAAAPGLGAPIVPDAKNWLALGPTVVMDGQTGGDERQPVAGRIAGLAVGLGGTVIYAASANGGVFRSHDGALSWDAMDQIDLDPTGPACASLICGAIAMNPANPRRVLIGTGEGATYSYFSRRVTGALPAYRGIGVLRTDDRGANWTVESGDLAGQAFFALVLNPSDPEQAVAGTTAGLYRRKPQPGGQFEWVRVASGVFSSVVVAAAASTVRFFAARWPQDGDPGPAEVLSSSDGETWQAAGTGFPTDDVQRITLGVQLGNPNLVYAIGARRNGTLRGLYRLDGIGQAWKSVTGLPNLLPVDDDGKSQGNYDLAIAVDPENSNLIYLGGSYHPELGGASIWRCEIQQSGSNYRVSSYASIGEHAHSDVHVLVHSPGNPNELWCGCDGGVFLNRDPRGTGKFTAQNNGLACLCCNFIAQHPTDPSIVFTGLQDNGTAMKTGSFWRHVQDGDGGYCVINWADPDKVLVFCNGRIYRSTTGGKTHESWHKFENLGWRTMTQPIVGVPYNPNPAHVTDANLVATGVGSKVWFSDNFGDTWIGWPDHPGIRLGAAAGDIFALAFASPTRLFIGTTKGKVFRADRSAAGWTAVLLEGTAAQLGVAGVVADIAVDWADSTLNSIYVAFGSLTVPTSGEAVASRVWWFDGQDWHVRSGTAPLKLLGVEHNAISVDPRSPNHVYVGADIGVWHSADGGLNWDIFQNGLPDAPVFDLQIHPTQRLLRVATHGRGIYEIEI
jgi:hypothetical protein